MLIGNDQPVHMTQDEDMEVRVEGPTGKPIQAPGPLIDRLACQLHAEQKDWLRQLTEEPARFADLELSVHDTFRQLAAQLVASLLAQASRQSPALEAAKKK
jgi:hypothetical protein